MELVKLEFILDSILEVNMTACLVHKELSSTIGDTLLLENDLPLETLRVVDAVAAVGKVDKVVVVGIMVVVKEVESGVEETLKARLQQSYPKLPKMELISSLLPWKLLQLLLALSMDNSQEYHHSFLLLIQLLLFLMMT